MTIIVSVQGHYKVVGLGLHVALHRSSLYKRPACRTYGRRGRWQLQAAIHLVERTSRNKERYLHGQRRLGMAWAEHAWVVSASVDSLAVAPSVATSRGAWGSSGWSATRRRILMIWKEVRHKMLSGRDSWSKKGKVPGPQGPMGWSAQLKDVVAKRALTAAHELLEEAQGCRLAG